MRISYSWLRELIPDLSLAPQQLAERLTGAGLEVEGIEDPSRHWDSIVVGYVETREKHPNADKLSVCQVRISADEVRQIVCGAANVDAGQKVVVALEGACLPGDFKIKKAKIRGTESRGMICSEKELGLAEESDGILVLQGKQGQAAPGTPLRDVLPSATVLEISITPNRGDCLSAIGLAREIAALTGKTLRLPAYSVKESGAGIGQLASVKVEAPDLCPRYCARVIEGLTVKPSPEWLAALLETHGIRPINNLVDVTNYILLLYGQPLHAFDLDHVADHQIIVRKAARGEKIKTLDDTERILEEGMLVIADPQGAVAVAGVMGGARSEVRETTTRVLLESACFQPGQVRRTSRTLGLISESSYRFERGVDPRRVPAAMDHAASLMAELGGGTVRCGTIDAAASSFEPLKLVLRPARVAGLLGLRIPADRIAAHLRSLGFETSGAGESLAVQVPTYRTDITCEADLIEEVARLEGYDKIPETLPGAEISTVPDDEPFTLRRRIEDTLASRGWRQAIHLSFIGASWPDLLGLAADDPRRQAVRVANPINEEQGVLRAALLPALLETYVRNRNRGVRQVRLFEMGRTFRRLPGTSESDLPQEELFLALICGGVDEPALWRSREEDRARLFEVKADLLAVAERLGLQLDMSLTSEEPFLHPGRRTALRLQGKVIGAWGELAPDAAEKYGIRERVIVAELSARALLEAASTSKPSFQPFGRFPSIWRDLALLLADDVPSAAILAAAKSAGKPLVLHAEIFDEFKGKGVPEGQKSLGLRLCYGALDRTLTEQEAADVENRVLEFLGREFNAQRRG